MQYTFNIEIAQKYSVNEAIMLQNFQFWISKNRKSANHQHKGRTWTYNSLKNFQEIFPFWSKSQIERILKKLVQNNILITGNFNSKKQDRTCWYAFKNEKEWLQNSTSGQNVQKLDSTIVDEIVVQKTPPSVNNKGLQKLQLHSNTLLDFEKCKFEKQDMQISKTRSANLEIEKSYKGTDKKHPDRLKKENKRFDENFLKVQPNKELIQSLVLTFLQTKTSTKEEAEILALQFLHLHPNVLTGNLRKNLQKFWQQNQIKENKHLDESEEKNWMSNFLMEFNCRFNTQMREKLKSWLRESSLIFTEIQKEFWAFQEIKKSTPSFYQSMRWETFFRKIEEGHSFLQEWEKRKLSQRDKAKNIAVDNVYRPRQKPNKVLPNSNPRRYFRGKISTNRPEVWHPSFQNIQE